MVRTFASIAVIALTVTACQQQETNDTTLPGTEQAETQPNLTSDEIRREQAEKNATRNAQNAQEQPSQSIGKVSPLIANVSDLSVRQTEWATIVELPADALFEFDSATLSPNATSKLKQAAEYIRKSPEGTITIAGHTDNKGSDAYNDDLSKRRAEAVMTWMKGQVGVRTRAFAIEAKGESAPVAPNAKPDGSDNPDGRAKNRRVEIIIPR